MTQYYYKLSTKKIPQCDDDYVEMDIFEGNINELINRVTKRMGKTHGNTLFITANEMNNFVFSGKSYSNICINVA